MPSLKRLSTIFAATTGGAVGGASIGAVLLTIGGFAVLGPPGAAIGWAAGAGLGAAAGATGGAHLGKRVANALGDGDGDDLPPASRALTHRQTGQNPSKKNARPR
jgi:hypothetical protein